MASYPGMIHTSVIVLLAVRLTIVDKLNMLADIDG